MYGLIQTLYDEKKQGDFISLYDDSSVKEQMALRATLASALKDCPKILPSHGTDWILCTLTQHERDEHETARVFHGIMKYLNEFSYGLVDEKIRYRNMCDVADSCLVGVGFFREHMERRHRLRAAPSVDYYSRMGALAYHRTGFEELGDHFDEWVRFIEKEFTI